MKKCTCDTLMKGFTCDYCNSKPKKKSPLKTQSEQALQRACVSWFRIQYPDFVLFSVRNEAKYQPDQKHYGMLANKAGRHAGISDLVLLLRRKGYGALMIELKTKTGKSSKKQLEFASYCVNQGYMYALVRSLDEFIEICKDYIHG